jgi:hypothetical protein
MTTRHYDALKAVEKRPEITAEDTLKTIKELRDRVNDQGSENPDWANRVAFHLDRASDVLEFER